MQEAHDHTPQEECRPTCPGWSQGALHLLALQHRFPEMLAACRAAARIESVVVAPSTAGVVLPEYLKEEELVRLNLVVGRDAPEVLLDEWGIRAQLTFRGKRNEVALPWPSILAGQLTAPPRQRPRFSVIEGGKKD